MLIRSILTIAVLGALAFGATAQARPLEGADAGPRAMVGLGPAGGAVDTR